MVRRNGTSEKAQAAARDAMKLVSKGKNEDIKRS